MSALFAVLFIAIIAVASGFCPDGFLHHGSSCYHFSHDTEDWTNARTLCQYLKAELAEITDADEDRFVMGQVQVLNKPFWVGANDLAVETDWVWASGGAPISSHTYSNWGAGQPSNSGGNENCMEIGPGAAGQQHWNDVACRSFRYYICEKPFEDQAEIIG